MPRLLIISFLFLSCALQAAAQTLPPVTGMPGTGSVTPAGFLKKAAAKKDSIPGREHPTIIPGQVRDQAGKQNLRDTLPLAAKRMPRLANTETAPDPAALVPSLDHGSCKGVVFIPVPGQYENVQFTKDPFASHPQPPPPHVPFLQVHGNVLYNLNYYSRVDTPYSENNIYQHTIQVYLDVLLKGEYPFRVYLTNHFSNSSVFRNFSDLNMGYNNAGFSQLIRDRLRGEFLQTLPSRAALDSLQRLLDEDRSKLRGLDGWQKNPALIQRMVEARERTLRRPTPKADSSSSPVPNAGEMDSVYSSKRKEADSIRNEIESLQKILAVTHQRSAAEVDRTLQDIQRLDNPAQLQKKMQLLGLSDSSLPKGYKTLMAIKSFNVGRTVVNYSELSVKNISINGVQAEYNPSTYYAFATGSVDYRFRDIVVQAPGQSRQYLNVFRVGKGYREGNSLILTYFTGRRQLYNAATSDTSHVRTPSASLMGLTLEGNYRLTKNILFTGEIAKSSSPAYSGDSSHKTGAGYQLFSLTNHSNEAWSLKLNASFPATRTKIRAAYKHLAVNYQSFSIFTDGSAQSAWSANIDQMFFKKQLDITLGANTNDFSNPLISQEYRSTTVFKSVQATLRKPYWPVISLGYFPSSQITRLGNNQYIENLFYTMVGNITHSYSYHQVMMNTALVYTQFYNRASDSGFTYFNTHNLMLSQSLFLGKMTLQFNASAASNQDYQLFMLEGRLQHAISQALSLGAGIKYNKQTAYHIEEMGYSAEATLRIPQVGQIQFSADKGFVPGMNKQLVPDNTGRLTYFKTF